MPLSPLLLALFPALAVATPLFNNISNGTITTNKSFITKNDTGIKTATILGPILGALAGVLILAWVGWVLHTARQWRRKGIVLDGVEGEGEGEGEKGVVTVSGEVVDGMKEGKRGWGRREEEMVPEVGGLTRVQRAWLKGSR